MSDGFTIKIKLTTQSRTMDDFVIIWFDSNLDESNEDTRNSIGQLRNIVDCIKTFTNADECIDCLQNIKDKTVFMIIHESFDRYLVLFLNLIEDMTQLHSLYIINNDHVAKFKQYKKLKVSLLKLNICTMP